MIIAVRVHPKSSKNEVVPKPDGSIEVYVTLPPVKNLANKAVVELLAAHFDVPLSSVKIIRGFTSRYKQVEINPSP